MKNRIIKFRAYDKTYGIMFDNAYPFEHLVYVEIDKHDPQAVKRQFYMQEVNGKWFYFILAKEAELLQFTGLFSAKGEEIYEGDILCISLCGENVIGSVYFEEGAWYWKNELLAEFASAAKIIGNVLENPELIDN